MRIIPLWASFALLWAPAVLAQATATSATSTTTTAATPSCTASQIASLCSYPDPGPDFAVAIDSRASCWDYCNNHSPCSFVIFAAGNPNTGTGTCWLYPGESFNPSAGSSDCANPSLFVYGQPECAGGSPTTTSSGACAATATPSAVASVCGYPTPGDCFYGCTASEGASDCLSQCAKAASCSYVVFNPHNPSNSPFAAGTCWIYPNGTYNAGSAATCSGDPEQFVYNNLCPKPSPSRAPSSLSSTATASTSGSGTARATTGSNPSSQNLAPARLPFSNSLAMGVAMLMWHGL